MPSRIHDLIRQLGIIVAPGVYDALGAKIAVRAGFEALFISGYSVAASQLGEPDFGLLTQTEMINTARNVCKAAASVPVIVDADTGYGNALNVVRTVNDLMAAGAAGMFLEDQVWPKKCGHMRGKRVVPLEEYLQKLRAAVEAKGERDFFIVARTDARAAVSLDEAIRRCKAFKEAGADALFVEAPQSLDEMKRVAHELPPPLVANMLEGGVTPLLNRPELVQLGFQLVVFPLCGLYAAAKAMSDVFSHLRNQGTTRDVCDRLMVFDDFHKIVGLEEKYALEARFAGGA